MLSFGTEDLLRAANADPAFRLSARYWTARVAFEIGEVTYVLGIRDGAVIDVGRGEGTAKGPIDVRVSGPADAWEKLLSAVPPPRFDHIGVGRQATGLAIEGDIVSHTGPYYAAIQDLIAILRQAHSGPTPTHPVADVERAFDTAVGRYVYIRVQGVQYRVYFEEAGTGDIPLLLQHTAGADGRQWRHVLEDPDYQQLFRMIAYDLPYHGRSLPPTSERWWEWEYQLTKAFLMETVVTLSHALGLDRPAYMGCSVGGHLAPDLALYHPEEFRAVIGINSGLATPGAGRNEVANSWFHPRVANDWKAAAMLGNTAPTSPEAYRREVTWIYSQGAPPVLKGDVFYYSRDHDLTAEQARTIDTSKVDVYLLTGEYDFLAGDDGTAALAREIDGARFQLIPGLGHFGPSENPEDFKPHLLPVLQEIAARSRASR